MFSKKKRRNDYIHPRRSSLQVNLSYVSNLSESSETDNNGASQESLDRNVKRLREAILNKTREIFDNQNDFCQKTAQILGKESFSSDQNDQNESNSQEKRQKTEENGKLTPIDENSRKLASSPIISSSQNHNSTLSTIKTELSRTTLSKNETFVGNPLTSSTFCAAAINGRVGGLPETPRTSRPVVKSVRQCYVPLDKIDGYNRMNKSRNLKNVSMVMTPVQGNLLAINDKYCESSESGTSLEVRTSIDPVLSEKNSLGLRENSRLIHPAFSAETRGFKRKSLSLSQSHLATENGRNGEKNERLSLRVNTSLGSRRNSSVVEGTPFPVSRSMMLRTIRQSRVTGGHGEGDDDGEETGSRTIDIDPGPSTSFHKLASNNPSHLRQSIIEDSSDDGMSDTEPKNTSPSNTIIANSSDLSNDEMSESDDKPQVKKSPPRRRKLFSQLNNSGLITLSPIPDAPSPKVKTPIRKIRRRPKKILKITDNNDKDGKTQTQNRRLTQSRVKFEKILKTQEKKVCKKRNIISKKIVVKKKINPDVLRVLTEVDEDTLDNSEQGRDSLNDFTDNKRVATKSRHHNKTIYIVTTGLCNGDKDLVRNAVKKIGGAKIEATVTRQTTHVVTTGVRTINLLRGIIRGCWLVSLIWVKKSVEARKWLNPEKYEIDHFSKAVKENRKDREIFGRSYVPELFTTCGLIYIGHPTLPPREVLKELIKTAGGRIIEDSQKAKIIIGPNGLKEIWALDSITTGELQPTDQYQRQ